MIRIVFSKQTPQYIRQKKIYVYKYIILFLHGMKNELADQTGCSASRTVLLLLLVPFYDKTHQTYFHCSLHKTPIVLLKTTVYWSCST